jgi:hypothetical protein
MWTHARKARCVPRLVLLLLFRPCCVLRLTPFGQTEMNMAFERRRLIVPPKPLVNWVNAKLTKLNATWEGALNAKPSVRVWVEVTLAVVSYL